MRTSRPWPRVRRLRARQRPLDLLEERVHMLVLRLGLPQRTLQAMETLLEPRDFLRIHRSALVKLKRIRELRSAGSGRLGVIVHITSAKRPNANAPATIKAVSFSKRMV